MKKEKESTAGGRRPLTDQDAAGQLRKSQQFYKPMSPLFHQEVFCENVSFEKRHFLLNKCDFNLLVYLVTRCCPSRARMDFK